MGMIAAPGGTGKTRLGLQLAIGVALGTGWPWTGWARPGGRVLYLAAEERADTVVDRLRAVAQGTSMDPSAMESLDQELDLHSMISLPEATLAAGGSEGPLALALLRIPPCAYRLIVLDPLASFAGVDAENDNAAATRLVKYLRAVGQATGAAVLVLHHVAKAAILSGQTHLAVAARGAVALTDGVRWQAQLTRIPEEKAAATVDDAGLYRQLVVSKANHVRDGQTTWLRFGPAGVLCALAEPGAPAAADRRRAGPGW
ncbi:MAG: AAA family ATPase [Acidimicrobiales bacterium]